MFGCYLWSSGALINLIVVRNVEKNPVRVHLEVQEIIVHSIDSEAFVVDVTDI